ncbi:hypothetical protein B9Z55_000476 [Caenorhabditis nigoni]|uniref:Uncharacterized protein n=1 Tax=Caenorhabditis nigoni TaxID=1611254 RepID=A0A2G5VTA5_9PELO|nr:hypothetical protein B9Z55_000476 [Caenorhabditis nigoni]
MSDFQSSKNAGKTEEELREKLLRKCIGRYNLYVSRCREMEGHLRVRRYSRYRTVPITYLIEQLEQYDLKELQDWFKKFKVKDYSLIREEWIEFHEIVFHPEDIAEHFMNAWKWIKKNVLESRKLSANLGKGCY